MGCVSVQLLVRCAGPPAPLRVGLCETDRMVTLEPG
jgi:hypothetical protein